jgi:hypothetical protein
MTDRIAPCTRPAASMGSGAEIIVTSVADMPADILNGSTPFGKYYE